MKAASTIAILDPVGSAVLATDTRSIETAITSAEEIVTTPTQKSALTAASTSMARSRCRLAVLSGPLARRCHNGVPVVAVDLDRPVLDLLEASLRRQQPVVAVGSEVAYRGLPA